MREEITVLANITEDKVKGETKQARSSMFFVTSLASSCVTFTNVCFVLCIVR